VGATNVESGAGVIAGAATVVNELGLGKAATVAMLLAAEAESSMEGRIVAARTGVTATGAPGRNLGG